MTFKFNSFIIYTLSFSTYELNILLNIYVSYVVRSYLICNKSYRIPATQPTKYNFFLIYWLW